MKYKKNTNENLDNAFKNATKHGMNIKLFENILFYRKGFHWEFIEKKDVKRLYRRVEEVISHTSCCAENMDIDKLIAIGHDDSETIIHVCDGERRLAERLYSDITSSWDGVEFGKA